MKDRESQAAETEQEHQEPAVAEHDSQPSGDSPDDNEPDVEVREEGDRVTVNQRSPGTRGQRRAEERRREREENNQRIAGLEAQIKRLTETITTQRAQPSVQQPTTPVQSSEPSLSREEEGIVREQEDVVRRIERERDPDKIESLRQKWHSLESQRVRHASRPAIQEEVRRILATMPPPEPFELTRLRQEYQDVMENDDARSLAQSYAQAAIIRAKRTGKSLDPLKVHRESLQKAAVEFGLRQEEAPEPTPQQRSKFSGAPTGSAKPGAVSRQLDAHEKRMAEAWAEGTNIPKEKVYSEYIKQVLLKGDPEYFSRRK